MTRDEAIEQFMSACYKAIDNDQAVIAARRHLACQGLKIESLAISCDLSIRAASPAVDDSSFLRKLHITPDLEVRE